MNYIKAPRFSLVRLAIFARVFYGHCRTIIEIAAFYGYEIQSKKDRLNKDNTKADNRTNKETIIKT